MNYNSENYDQIDLNDFEFTDYTLQYMKEYFDLKDIPNVEGVIIDKVKDDAKAKAQLVFVETLQRSLMKSLNLKQVTPEMMEFMTRAESFKVGSEVFLVGDDGVKGIIGDVIDKFDDILEVVQLVGDVYENVGTLYKSINQLNADMDAGKYPDPDALADSLNAAFGLSGTIIENVFDKFGSVGGNVFSIMFSVSQNVLQRGKEVVLEGVTREALYELGLSTFPEKDEQIERISKGDFENAGITIKELDEMYREIKQDKEEEYRFRISLKEYTAWRYEYEITEAFGGESNFYWVVRALEDYKDAQPGPIDKAWKAIKKGASNWIDFWENRGGDVYDVTSNVYDKTKDAVKDTVGLFGDIIDIQREKREAKDKENKLKGLSSAPSSGDDYIMGSDKSDEVHALGGNDHIHTFDGDDYIYGDDGDDWLYGGGGNDTIYGGEGDDLIRGGADDDKLIGQGGDDEIYGEDGNDHLYGGDEHDLLDGGEGNDELIGGSDTDLIFGGNGDDLIYGDFVGTETTRDAMDFIYGGAGNDHIFGGGGDDVIHGDGFTTAGEELPISEAGNDTIDGGSGNDTIFGGYGNDKIDGGSGNDEIYGEGDDDTINGGDGRDYIEGGIGNDRIHGNDGDDVINGGHGNDYLYGDYGDDTYVFNKYFGHDYLYDAHGISTIYFEGWGLSDFEITRVSHTSKSIMLKTINSGNDLTITNFLENQSKFHFVFENEDEEKIFNLVENEDGSFNFEERSQSIGGKGLHWSFSDSGISSSGSLLDSMADLIGGGTADDYVTATTVQPPRDPLVIDLNGDGVHTTDVENGVYFDLDNNGFAERTAWIDNIDGFLVYNRDGDPNITNGSELFSDQVILPDGTRSTHGFDVLKVFDTNNDGVVDKNDDYFTDLRVWIDKDHNGISDNPNEQELFTLDELGIETISTYYIPDPEQDENDPIKNIYANIKMKDGSTTKISEHWFDAVSFDTQELNTEGIDDDRTSFGNMHSISYVLEHDDTGTLENLVERFKVSDNYVEKRAITREILYYITGAIDITPNSRGGSVDARSLHVIETIMGVETFIGADGGTTPNSNAAPILNKLYTNFEELYFNLLNKDSHVTEFTGLINEEYDEETDSTVLDLLHIKEKIDDRITNNINVDEIIFSTSSFLSNYDKAFGTAYLEEFKTYYPDKAAEIDVMVKATLIVGSDGNDNINATNSQEIIWGGKGNDTINAGNGNDYVYGGAGDDILNGGAGDDTYYFGTNHGNDVVRDTQGNNKLIFSDGISAEDYDISVDAKLGFVLTHKETGETISMPDFLTNPLNYNFVFEGKSQTEGGIEDREVIEGTDTDDYIEAGDGFNIFYGGEGNDTLAGGKDMDFMYGGDGDDLLLGRNGVNVLFGGNGNDTIYDGDDGSYLSGGEGDDFLYGGGGADVLDGGAGNDYLQGDHGDDTYIFGKGYDTDTINASSGNNTIIIYGYRASSMINTRNAHNDLIINFGSADSTDCLIVDHFFDYNSNRDFNFVFDDGTVLGQYDITAKYAPIYGTDGDDWLAIQNGDNGIIHGGAGNDGLSGGSGNDELYGEDGDDTLYGNDGNDILDGGTGNDTLCGGNGTDTYIFAKGYGNDTINEWGSGHSIVKLTDINSDEVTITDQWGSNLVVSINETEDTLIISNFKWGQATYSFEFADGAIASVNKDTWELEFSKLPDIPETSEDELVQDNADILSELYADGSLTSDILTETDSTVISDISDSVSVTNESDEVADQTDIQVMILTENMSAFADEDNVFDNADVLDSTDDMSMMNQLLVGSNVQ